MLNMFLVNMPPFRSLLLRKCYDAKLNDFQQPGSAAKLTCLQSRPASGAFETSLTEKYKTQEALKCHKYQKSIDKRGGDTT